MESNPTIDVPEPRCQPSARAPAGTPGVVAAWWGVIGVSLMLVYAIFRLTPIALAIFDYPLAAHHWTVLVTIGAFMLYSEGYRGFQKSFSPRVAERAASLRTEPTLLRGILAPLFCIGYFASPPRLRTSVLLLTVMIAVLVVVVHRLDQPWRGIIDAGVVLGLAWGLAATLLFSIRRLATSR